MDYDLSTIEQKNASVFGCVNPKKPNVVYLCDPSGFSGHHKSIFMHQYATRECAECQHYFRCTIEFTDPTKASSAWVGGKPTIATHRASTARAEQLVELQLDAINKVGCFNVIGTAEDAKSSRYQNATQIEAFGSDERQLLRTMLDVHGDVPSNVKTLSMRLAEMRKGTKHPPKLYLLEPKTANPDSVMMLAIIQADILNTINLNSKFKDASEMKELRNILKDGGELSLEGQEVSEIYTDGDTIIAPNTMVATFSVSPNVLELFRNNEVQEYFNNHFNYFLTGGEPPAIKHTLVSATLFDMPAYPQHAYYVMEQRMQTLQGKRLQFPSQLLADDTRVSDVQGSRTLNIVVGGHSVLTRRLLIESISEALK